MVTISVFNNNFLNKYYQQPILSNNTGKLKLKTLTKDTVSFTGKPVGISLYNKLLKDISATADDAVCSLEDAVAEFISVDLPNKVKADYIMSCVYKGTKHDMVINKKALLMLKKQILEIQNMPDLIESVQKCLDSRHKSFNSKMFKNIFDARKQVNINDIQPVYSGTNYHYIEMDRRNKIIKALNETQFKNFETSDLFVPLESIRRNFITDINKVRYTTKKLPDALYEKFVKEINNNNFDLKSIFTEYYSKLKICHNLEDVQKYYPELKFRKSKPDYDSSLDKISIHNIIAKSSAAAYDRMILEALQQGYIELIPQNSLKVKLPNHKIKSAISLKIAGIDIPAPPDELLEIFKQGEEIINKYKDMPPIDYTSINKLAENHAVRKSRYWADYKGMTNNDIWMPIRFIRDKYSHPHTTEYSSDKLIDEFIASTYLQRGNLSVPNPLEPLDRINSLTSEIINIIDNIYMSIYRKQNHVQQIEKNKFREISSRIDRKALDKSIRHLENIFRNSFMSMYHSGPRKERYEKEFKIAKNLIDEKIQFKNNLTKKQKINDPPQNPKWVQGELNFD